MTGTYTSAYTGDQIDAAIALANTSLQPTSSSSQIAYQPAGTGAVATTVQAKLREFVSPEDFGAVGDGVADDTSALTAAIAYCVSSGFRLTGQKTYKITGTVIFRYIEVDFTNATINVAHSGIGIIIGGNASNGNNPTQKFGEVTRSVGSDSTTTPTVRAIGVKGQYIHLERTTYFQVYADTGTGVSGTDYSSAYSSYWLKSVTTLELTSNFSTNGSSSQWINENQFFLNRTNTIIIDGTYSHNHNIFHRGTMEGVGVITINNGRDNQIRGMRFERNPSNPAETLTITFGANANNNFVEASWNSNPSYANAPYGTDTGQIIVSDSGIGNSVVHIQEDMFRDVKLLELCPSTPFVSSINNGIAGFTTLVGNTDLDGVSNVKHLLTGNFRIRTTAVPIYNQPDQLLELQPGDMVSFVSDLTGFRPRIFLYDANRNLITTQPVTAPIAMSSLAWNSGGFYTVNANVQRRSFYVVDNSVVKFFRLAVWAGNSLSSFDFKSLRIVVRFKRGLTANQQDPRRFFGLSEPRRLPSLIYADATDVNMNEVGQGIPCYKFDMSEMKINLRRILLEVTGISGNILTVTYNPQYAPAASSVVLYLDGSGAEQTAAISAISSTNITLASTPPVDIVVGSRIVLIHTLTKALP